MSGSRFEVFESETYRENAVLSSRNKTNGQEEDATVLRMRPGVVVGQVRSEMDGERLTPGTQPRGKVLHHTGFRAGLLFGHPLREKSNRCPQSSMAAGSGDAVPLPRHPSTLRDRPSAK